MEKKRFLLELGCEELPDKQIEIAIQSVTTAFANFLQINRLNCDSFKVSGSPRRIYLDAIDMDAQQADEELLKIGPAVAIAYTKDGALSPAGLGFLRKCQRDATASFLHETDKGSFIAVKQENKGKPTTELLQTWVPESVLQIPFANKMIWDNPSFGFSRPLRWILALWDDKPLTMNVFGILSGNKTYGNRYLGLEEAIFIDKADSYLTLLKENKVIADAEARKQMISDQVGNIFKDAKLQVLEDKRLVETVANLVEYPHAVVAQFEAKYLSLPEKIIISTISQNQKYFSVVDAGAMGITAALSNYFVFISNGDPQWSDLIKAGNQKVVNARLADAMWYYKEDTAHPLESYVPKLQGVVFQSKLGTLADKTDRICKLADKIATDLKLDEQTKTLVLRCAKLCKADLVTTMLGEKEFTKLQGYIGKQYALASGESEEVAAGIYEHYMPRGSADDLPKSICGKIVAIADKLDTVCGIIGVGMLPTGSGDPFALRRAANGIVQIISDNKWDIDLFEIADFALKLIELQTDLEINAQQNIHSFLDQRVVGHLKTRDIAYDVIDSVMHINKSRINELENRALALNEIKSHEDFIKLVIGFKRVSNIISATKEFGNLDESLLMEPAEQHLHQGLQSLNADIDTALQTKDYQKALHHLLNFGTKIDSFFDEVLVNCDSETLRSNRHALLLEIRKQFLRVADLSLIVLETNGEI